MEPAQNTPAPVPDPGPEPPARPAPRRRRTARTVGLIAIAAVIGLVGGTAVGYSIQADREPTPLPPLNQPGLAYPKPLPKGQKQKRLPAAEDRQAKAQGDLRKLLVPKPAGAKEDEYAEDVDGWMTVDTFAAMFENPGEALEEQLDLEIRRVAATSWTTGEHKRTHIRLIQYRSAAVLGAQEFAEGQHAYLPDEDWADEDGTPIKGSTDGRSYVFPVDRKPGYLDLYEARAVFHRGDIAVEIFITDTKKISGKEIRSLAERQLGRL
ncbi:hypothetical protein ACFY9F_30760 [Streptomyces sp. NPDC012421]|uniref:hypothetical protein n=1 Tax=Streptomyces sp. NPDC012421 TaxID=3364832 RepID=UPI0036EDE3AA